MTFSVYTSCALNYLPKARALAESLRRHQPDARLTLCLNDIPPAWLDLSAEPFDQIWQPADLGFDPAWIFQHNVMELSTAVKGRALQRLMAEDEAALFLYLDPDVYLFDRLDSVSKMMEGASIGLVPHILAPEQTDTGVRLTEISVTTHGIYNLGHLVVRPDATGHAFADWWTARLDRYCFDDPKNGLFTDQRWCDLVPTIFDNVRILRDPGLNVASWNIATREIRRSPCAQRFTAGGAPLLTYHFSGTGPTGTHTRVRACFDSGNAATAEIERIYEAAISRHGQQRFADSTPAFDTFDDGTVVTGRARRLYRQHLDLQAAFHNPYATPTHDSYLGWLRENRPGMVDGIAIGRERCGQAFAELFDERYYLSTYPEAAAAIESGVSSSAEQHYCQVGSRLGFDPNPFFVSSYYRERADELGTAEAGWTGAGRENTLLWHYLTIGLLNGIEPIEFFDSRWYLDQNHDIEAALRTGRVTSPIGHFLRHGASEGRDPGPNFTGGQYLATAPEARDLIEHGRVRGAFEAFVALGGVAGRVRIERAANAPWAEVAA